MTVGVYIRVSTLEQAQEGYSIAAQKERLTAYCAAQGWDDFKFYVDEGVSAKDTNRPQLQLLMEHVKNEKISMILVYRLDRFTRSVKDLYSLLELLEKHKCAFKSATEIYDTSSAMGRMFIGLVALLAQWETENLSERVKMALEKKVSGGEHVGAVVYGFDLSDDEKLVKNEKSLIVLNMIDQIKKGKSALQVAEYLNKTNSDKTWRAMTVLRILKNPALYGATRWVDDIYENTHEGIISKDEFIKLQDILDARTIHRKRDAKSTYLFQGVLTCPMCERPLSVNRYIRNRKDGSTYQGAIYRCQECFKNGQDTDSIGEHRFVDALYNYMKNVVIENIEPVEEQDNRTILVGQLQNIERKREKYQKGWASDLISDKEFEKRMNETREVYSDLKQKLNEMKTPMIIDTDALKEIVFTFNTSFDQLTTEEKRSFVSQFIKRIDFDFIHTAPKRPERHKKGRGKVVITQVLFY